LVINTSNTARTAPQLRTIKMGLGAIDRNRQRHFGRWIMKARSSVFVATLPVACATGRYRDGLRLPVVVGI
jgi:hypothetical protein